MKKEVMLSFGMVGLVIFFVALSQTEADSPPAPKSSSAFEAFGIQMFQEKKEPFPFSLKDLNGNSVSLSDYKGKPVLLFFWATWCVACKEDIVLLEKFSEGKRGQLEILTIAIDGEKEKRVRRVVHRYRVTLPVLLDIKEKVARSYRVKMVPSAFIINREGWMEGMIVGQRDWCGSAAEAALKEFLNPR